MYKTIVNDSYLRPTELRPGQFVLLEGEVQQVDSLAYDPVNQEVTLATISHGRFGADVRRHRISAHAAIRRVILREV